MSGNLMVAAVLITWLILAARTRTWPFERECEDCDCEEPEDEVRNPATPDPRHDRPGL